MRKQYLFAVLAAFLSVILPLHAAPPRALPAGELPNDVRLKPLKDLDGYFPFTPPKSPAEWNARAERVRTQILVAEGLWPMPTKTPLNAVIHGKIERPDYTVEKVYFESAPGFFVTGNLYRPKKITGKVPGVLFAHGHWKDARLSESSDDAVQKEIATGQERFERGGRSIFQSMCVQLARMGCVVWQWDMLSDSDSIQFSPELIHRFAKQRPEMNTTENWGLFSPQAEAHLQSVMGLQTWNSVRSLDFLLSLPEVDPERIAMTGASGGGTQTMILAAIDPRVKLAFPGRHGQHRHARRLHLRKRVAPPRRHRQRRVRRPVRPQAARHDHGQRLDEADVDQGLSPVARAVRTPRQTRKRHARPRRTVSAQLQRRLASRLLQMAQRALQTRPARSQQSKKTTSRSIASS